MQQLNDSVYDAFIWNQIIATMKQIQILYFFP